MQDFIVLGIIPGTNIQLDFTSWLIICACLLGTSLLFVERHSVRTFALSWYAARLIKRHHLA